MTDEYAVKRGSEKHLEEIFIGSVRRLYREHAYLRKTHPDKFEGKGKPDYVGHIYGVHVEIELKVEPNRPSKEQKSEIRQVTSSGGFAAVLIWAKGSFYIVYNEHVETFSYRDRTHWQLLPHRVMGKTYYLDLRPLTANLALQAHKALEKLQGRLL
jgi:hypothetical protein